VLFDDEGKPDMYPDWKAHRERYDAMREDDQPSHSK
jgi:hypothetical protein